MAEGNSESKEEVEDLQEKLTTAISHIVSLTRGTHLKNGCGCASCTAKRFVNELV